MRREATALAASDVEMVRSLAGVSALAAEWQALWWQCLRASPFQHPGWLLPWWRHFGRGEPAVLTLRGSGGRLRGVVPLFRDSTDGRLRLIGTGISDVLDALAEDTAAAAVAAITGPYLERPGARLEALPEGAVLLTSGRPVARPVQQTVCPVLPLVQDGWDAALSPRLRQHLAYTWRRAGRDHDVAIETAKERNCQALLDALFRLHQARWRRRGAAGVLAETAVQAFHREAAAQLAADGLLRLHGLRLDGRMAAVYYGFAGHRMACYYLSGFDPAFGHLSPGSLILHHAVSAAAAEGMTEFQFLRGGEAYKYRWGAVDRASFALDIRPADRSRATAAAAADGDAP